MNNHVRTTHSQTTRPVRLKETVTLNIREVTAADAPLAVIWQDDEREFHTRWHEDRHYRKVEAPGYASNAVELLDTLAGEGRRVIEGFTFGFVDVPDRQTYDIGHRLLVDYDAEARAKARDDAEEWASRCLSIDGEMYMACAEPRFVLKPWSVAVCTNFMESSSMGTHWRRPNEEEYSPWFETERYPLSCGETALDKLAEWYHTDRTRIALPDVSVVIPESLGRDDPRKRLLEAADCVIRRLDGVRGFSSTPPEVLKAVIPLSEMLWKRDRESIDPDALVEVIDLLISNIQRFDMANLEFKSSDLSRMREAVRRFLDSEITVLPHQHPVERP
jgi:hypothetical protein